MCASGGSDAWRVTWALDRCKIAGPGRAMTYGKGGVQTSSDVSCEVWYPHGR